MSARNKVEPLFSLAIPILLGVEGIFSLIVKRFGWILISNSLEILPVGLKFILAPLFDIVGCINQIVLHACIGAT